MRLTGEPTDAALMSGRKRSIHDVEAAYASASRPAARAHATAPGVASALPPANKMHVDQDLLVQVLRAQLQAVTRDLRAHVSAQASSSSSSSSSSAALDRERALLAELENLAGNLEQDWVVALLSSDKPQYGFPDVLAALKARVKASRHAGQSCRHPAGVC